LAATSAIDEKWKKVSKQAAMQSPVGFTCKSTGIAGDSHAVLKWMLTVARL
jgi:hypothetical protein